MVRAARRKIDDVTRAAALNDSLPEQIANPKLIHAICARLRKDLADPELVDAAADYLTRIPIRSCRKAALAHVPRPWHVNTVLAAKLLYRTDPHSVLDALGAPNPATRANAALGLRARSPHFRG